jgi:hypothetical protein
MPFSDVKKGKRGEAVNREEAYEAKDGRSRTVQVIPVLSLSIAG